MTALQILQDVDLTGPRRSRKVPSVPRPVMVKVILARTLTKFFVPGLGPGENVLKASHNIVNTPLFMACLEKASLLEAHIMRMVSCLILFILLLSSSPASAYWYDRDYSYLNLAGGEVDQDLVKNYTLKISLQSETKIPYAGVFVRIFNASGVKIFQYLCEKPLLFMKLPASDYHVIAVDRQQVQRVKAFTIREGQTVPTVVTLRWPKDIVGY